MISLLKSISNGAETRVLLIGGERAILYLFQAGELAHAYIFTADPAGLAGFRRCLGESRWCYADRPRPRIAVAGRMLAG